MNQLVSIVVPIYNSDEYLRKCINSLIDQTYQNIEIILINDGSTDSSGEICDEFSRLDSRVRVKHKSNEGLSATRNLGINIAKGNYITFVDSDDWLNLNTIENSLNSMKENNVDIVFWSYIREYGNYSLPKDVINTSKKELYFNESETKSYILRKLVGPINEELKTPENLENMVTATMKLYKKNLISHIKFKDTKYIGTEDLLFNLYAFNNAKNTLYLNENYYHYRRDNENSLTRNNDRTLFYKWKNLFTEIEIFLKNNYFDKIYYEAFYNRINLSIISLGLVIAKDEGINYRGKILFFNEILNDELYSKAKEHLKINEIGSKWKMFFIFYKFNFKRLLLIQLKLIIKLLELRNLK